MICCLQEISSCQNLGGMSCCLTWHDCGEQPGQRWGEVAAGVHCWCLDMRSTRSGLNRFESIRSVWAPSGLRNSEQKRSVSKHCCGWWPQYSPDSDSATEPGCTDPATAGSRLTGGWRGANLEAGWIGTPKYCLASAEAVCKDVVELHPCWWRTSGSRGTWWSRAPRGWAPAWVEPVLRLLQAAASLDPGRRCRPSLDRFRSHRRCRRPRLRWGLASVGVRRQTSLVFGLRSAPGSTASQSWEVKTSEKKLKQENGFLLYVE